MPSRKLMAGAVGVVLFAVGAATAPADGPITGTTTPATTGVDTTSTEATTTAPAPVTTTAPAPTPTAPPPATTVSIPASPTTAPPVAKTPGRAPAGPVAPVRERSLTVGCPVTAAVMLLPGRAPLLLGSYASAEAKRAGVAKLVYRAGGGIVTGSGATLAEDGCTSSGPTHARAALSSLSLFGGAVTATRVVLTRGSTITTTVDGLTVDGASVSLRPGASIAVPGIGYLATGPGLRLPVSQHAVAAGALALHLTTAHAGLPAGSVVVVAAIGLPKFVPHASRPRTHVITRRVARKRVATATQRVEHRAHKARKRKAKKAHHVKHPKRSAAAKGQPLTVTPPLALRHYDFPVAGPADYGDSYGGFRGDVPGNWHHGDDIFAPLGTPVVAVANGTINRVGWEKLGGWRLWVRDDGGDQFYYAHLSGYAPSTLRSNRVTAGQVIGFVGNTGDAFTTAPHLHFEIHPRQLLHLHYNGAVDPTTYLEQWTRLQHVVVPKPMHPRLPGQPQLRKEARYVFRELLVARHLVRHRPSTKERPRVRIPLAARDIPRPQQPHEVVRAASAPRLAKAGAGSSFPTLRILGGLLGACAGAGVILLLRRRPSTG